MADSIPEKDQSDPTWGRYLFPRDDFTKMTDRELLDFIQLKIDDALDCTDGSDFHSDIRIDSAQDFIEQARDVLLDRGHVFSACDQERMSFLEWPLSCEQQDQRAKADLEEAAARAESAARFGAYCAAMERFVIGMVRGEPVERPAPGWYLTIGDCRAGARGGLSGAKVLEMVEKIEALTGTEPLLGYGCSGPGMTFSEDPAPAWSIRIPLTDHASVWALLMQWMASKPGCISAQAWDMRAEAADPFYVQPHVSVTHCFRVQPVLP